MPVLTTCPTVAVCTTHCKVKDRGIWKRSKWPETMANQYNLPLVEACCDVCLFVARRSLHALWSGRYTRQSAGNFSHRIENIVIISHAICGGEERGAGEETACLDLIAAGSRVRPSASHRRDAQ